MILIIMMVWQSRVMQLHNILEPAVLRIIPSFLLQTENLEGSTMASRRNVSDMNTQQVLNEATRVNQQNTETMKRALQVVRQRYSWWSGGLLDLLSCSCEGEFKNGMWWLKWCRVGTEVVVRHIVRPKLLSTTGNKGWMGLVFYEMV